MSPICYYSERKEDVIKEKESKNINSSSQRDLIMFDQCRKGLFIALANISNLHLNGASFLFLLSREWIRGGERKKES